MPEFLGIKYNLPVEILSVEDTREIETQSLALYRPGSGAQRWDLKIGLGPFVYTASEIAKIGVHQNEFGQRRPFSIEMPHYIGSEYDSDAVISLSNAVSEGSTVLTVRSNKNITVPLGRFFIFANHKKVYQILVDSNLSTVPRQIRIIPSLIIEIPQGTVLNFLNPTIKVLYHRNSPLSILHRATGRVEKIINIQEDIRLN